jgi:putative transposase
VKRHLEGDIIPPSVPARTVRLWLGRYRLAREQYGNGYVGLLPKISRRGNRTWRLPDDSRALLAEFVTKDYLFCQRPGLE